MKPKRPTLKTCAHCEGKPSERFNVNHFGEAEFYVECGGCGVRTDYYRTPSAARRAWNKRVECDPCTKAVARILERRRK